MRILPLRRFHSSPRTALPFSWRSSLRAALSAALPTSPTALPAAFLLGLSLHSTPDFGFDPNSFLSELSAFSSAHAQTNAEKNNTTENPVVAQADEMMRKRAGVADCEKALDLYRQELAREPDSLDLKLKVADVLNIIMRIRTDGNTMLIDANNDTAEHKKIWQKYSPEAYKLSKEVYKARPNNLDAFAIYFESYTFYVSTLGIVDAVMAGAADEFKANAQRMIDKYPKQDGGIGYMSMSAFYLAAPWPYGDMDKAKQYIERALDVDSTSPRNNYYAGVVAYRQKRYKDAAQYFEKAIKNPCSNSDKDTCSFLKREAKRGLNNSKNNQ